MRNCGMLGSCSATGSPGFVPAAAREAASRSEAASSSRYVSWPCANTTTGLSGEERAVSVRMTARLKLMALSIRDTDLVGRSLACALPSGGRYGRSARSGRDLQPEMPPGPPLCQDQVRHQGQPLLVELEG